MGPQPGVRFQCLRAKPFKSAYLHLSEPGAGWPEGPPPHQELQSLGCGAAMGPALPQLPHLEYQLLIKLPAGLWSCRGPGGGKRPDHAAGSKKPFTGVRISFFGRRLCQEVTALDIKSQSVAAWAVCTSGQGGGKDGAV